DHDLAFALEHPGDTALLAEVAAVFREEMADLADSSIAIISGDGDQNCRAAGAVAFEHDFIDLPAFELAGAAHDGALDVVGGHADRLGRCDRGTKPGVGVGIAAVPGGDGDFFDQAGESLPAFGIEGGFFVLDCRPFGMTGHTRTSEVELWPFEYCQRVPKT